MASVLSKTIELYENFTRCIDFNAANRSVTLAMQIDYDWLRIMYKRPSCDYTRADLTRMNEMWIKYNLKGYRK